LGVCNLSVQCAAYEALGKVRHGLAGSAIRRCKLSAGYIPRHRMAPCRGICVRSKYCRGAGYLFRSTSRRTQRRNSWVEGYRGRIPRNEMLHAEERIDLLTCRVLTAVGRFRSQGNSFCSAGYPAMLLRGSAGKYAFALPLSLLAGLAAYSHGRWSTQPLTTDCYRSLPRQCWQSAGCDLVA
jgi:hypothetical protein